MALDLQQRPPEHGHRRHHTRTEIEIGRVKSTTEPRWKWGYYHALAETINGLYKAEVIWPRGP